MKKINIKPIAMKILKITLSFALITWLIYSGKLDLKLILSTLTPSMSLLLIFLAGANVYIMNLRWYLLLRKVNLNTTMGESLQLALIGLFFNYVIPGAVGGDLVKAYYVTKEHPSAKLKAATSVLVDRIIGLYGMIFLAFVVVLLKWSWLKTQPALASISLAIIISFSGSTLFLAFGLTPLYPKIVAFIKNLGIYSKIHWLVSMIEALHSYVRSPLLLFKCLIISLISQCLFIFAFFYIAQVIGESAISLSTFFFVIPIGLIITALPLAPAGVGVGQVAFLFLFETYTGHAYKIGQTGITLLQIALFIWGLVGAYFYMAKSKNQKMALSSLEKVVEN